MPIVSEFGALAQILLIDLTLAGDNAVVVGLVAATVPAAQRRQVVAGGIAAAVVLRLALAAVARQLLGIVGLTMSGGILLLWVAWKLYREIRHADAQDNPQGQHRSALTAIARIALADLSMSLDNVLAVAGAAEGHPAWVLMGGLALALVFMAFVSNAIARLLHRMKWISYAGLATVVYVALRMIWSGGGEVFGRLGQVWSP